MPLAFHKNEDTTFLENRRYLGTERYFMKKLKNHWSLLDGNSTFTESPELAEDQGLTDIDSVMTLDAV